MSKIEAGLKNNKTDLEQGQGLVHKLVELHQDTSNEMSELDQVLLRALSEARANGRVTAETLQDVYLFAGGVRGYMDELLEKVTAELECGS